MAETNQTKYTEAFGAFAPALTVEELDSRIAKILEERFEKNNTREVKKFLHSTIDLTTLSGTDTEEKVAQLVASVKCLSVGKRTKNALHTATGYPLRWCGVGVACVRY